MNKVFSSENWTTVLYNVGQDELPLRQSIVTILFICAWFLFANCEHYDSLRPTLMVH